MQGFILLQKLIIFRKFVEIVGEISGMTVYAADGCSRAETSLCVQGCNSCSVT